MIIARLTFMPDQHGCQIQGKKRRERKKLPRDNKLRRNRIKGHDVKFTFIFQCPKISPHCLRAFLPTSKALFWEVSRTWPQFLMTNTDIPWATSQPNTSKVLLELHLQRICLGRHKKKKNLLHCRSTCQSTQSNEQEEGKSPGLPKKGF